MSATRFDFAQAKSIDVSQCAKCANYIKDGACVAFPKGIPLAIRANQHDHAEAYAGDGGIRFEAR